MATHTRKSGCVYDCFFGSILRAFGGYQEVMEAVVAVRFGIMESWQFLFFRREGHLVGTGRIDRNQKLVLGCCRRCCRCAPEV